MAEKGSEQSTEERTEAPTQFRREEFRRQGHVAISKELLSVILLMAVAGSMFFTIQIMFSEFNILAEQFFGFEKIDNFNNATFIEMERKIARSMGWMILPVLGVSALVGIVGCIIQIGFNFTWEPVVPNWDRLNPVQGFKRMFSAHALVEAAKAIIKLSVAMAVLWFFLKGQSKNILLFYQGGVPEQVALILTTVAKLFFSILAAMSVMAVLDYAFQKFQLEKQLKMTKREAKEEFKLREGDPLIKQRIRNVQRRMASKRMMEAVPKSDVVVTNPTHLAIALQYDADTMGSPKVAAKGAGLIAQKIKEVARFHQIPIVENKPLARTLFKKIEVNQFIPRDLFKAVAEVLAYVYRLKKVRESQVNYA